MDTDRENWTFEMVNDLGHGSPLNERSYYTDSESQSLESRDWSLHLLKQMFTERNLEDLFSKYGLRLHRGYFSIFLLVQTSITLTHIAVLIFYAIDNSSTLVITDILSYLLVGIAFWILAIFVFNQDLVKKHNWLPQLSSAFAILFLILVDTALPLYHTVFFHSRLSLRPAYSTHALLACHVFYPQDNHITPAILGATTAIYHISYLYLVTYRKSEALYEQLLSDVVFFVALNLLGMYYRYINEIFIRRTFLDKRACVESKLKLNYEKEREEQLMLSILPRHLASRVMEDIRKKLISNRIGKRMLSNPYTELYIERHNDVSILYADVVNYTKMTSTLPVNRLVEVLTELFGRFDEASEKHKVLRIKFLGDCYYCVSGVPRPNPDHAKSCVDLALDMIKIIQEVREANDLNIDMRIGIHSGNIICGILGKCKWQYDIWSKDVIIANHMEQSGKSGMIHITRQTLEKLGSNYDVEPGFGHLRDELLAKCNIETFFIKPQTKVKYLCLGGMDQSVVIPETGVQTSILWRIPAKGQERRRRNFDRSNSSGPKIQKHGTDYLYKLQKDVLGSGHMLLSRRRAQMRNSGAVAYQQRLKMADANMEKDIEKLPIGKLNQWFRKDRVRFLCLIFYGKKQWEIPFLRQPDPLFKYYVASAIFVLLALILLHCLSSLGWSTFSYVIYGVSLLFLVVLLPFTWTHFIWNELRKNDSDAIPQPKNSILRVFHGISVKVIWSPYPRMLLYIVTCFLLTFCLLTKVMQVYLETEVDDTENDALTISWQLTEGCSLLIIMSFLFFRIHFLLKLFIALLISTVYICCIYYLKDSIDSNYTWNPGMPSIVANILSILFLTLELHFLDRQREFMSRLDFCWKKQMFVEQDEMTSTRSINKMLLQNILPIHVAEIYLNPNASPNELYHEDYECVSVMFASLTNYSLYNETDSDVEATECHSLRILNMIVCNFDDALLTKEFRRIEKIKVAGWTYMAACGLTPGTRNSNGMNIDCDNHVIITMIRFATEMMKILKRINNKHSTDFGLKVGISHGPVTAGGVGSHKPYYDIWGNTVNVASRMDSTGEAGKIQVPDETAKLLPRDIVECTYRGNIFVKGKGNMDTYFVRLSSESDEEESRL